ncbi:MAG: PilC/PilY family type IV pilus protein [bacterium]
MQYKIKYHVSIIIIFFIVCNLALSTPHAEMTPLFEISHRMTKVNMLIVFDTSGSMRWDIDGDELSEPSTPDIDGLYYGAHPESRLAMAKDAITYIVKDTQDVANFALMTFKQTHYKYSGHKNGYFPYYKLPSNVGITEWKSPGTCADAVRESTNPAWQDPEDAMSEDDQGAECNIDKGSNSDWLRCTNFGFTSDDIPSGSTISGIEVQIVRQSDDDTGEKIVDSAVYLRNTSGQVGDNKASAAAWSETDETVTYGGDSDTWNAWLLDTDIVNNSDFGVDLSAYNSANEKIIAEVDHVRIRVHYIKNGQITMDPVVYQIEYPPAVVPAWCAKILTKHKGYTGSGYADFKKDDGLYIEWKVTVPANGNYKVIFRYALKAYGRPMDISVNGVLVDNNFHFRQTGQWYRWREQERIYALTAGENTIRLTTEREDGPNFDKLTVKTTGEAPSSELPLYHFAEYYGKTFTADGTESAGDGAGNSVTITADECFRYYGGHDNINFKVHEDWPTWNDSDNVFGAKQTYDSDRGGMLLVPFSFGTPEEEVLSADEILEWMRPSNDGGLVAIGATPTGSTLKNSIADNTSTTPYFDDAYAYYKAVTDPSDPLDEISCRHNYVLFITDGEPTPDSEKTAAESAAAALYSDCNVVTYMIGFGSDVMDEDAKATLNAIAKAGHSPLRDSGDYAYYADTKEGLVNSIRRIIYEAAMGDYATSSPTVATLSPLTYVTNNIGVLATVEFPDWFGHLHSYDFETESMKWDAGEQLLLKDPNDRKIYTLGSNKALLPFWVGGAANADNLKHLCEDNSELAGKIIRFTSGYGTSWYLYDITNCTAAAVGPPYIESDPNLAITHKAFETLYSCRRTVVYAGANNGMLHCFDLETGEEIFAYIPQDLFPKLIDIYEIGGQAPSPKEHIFGIAASPKACDVQIGTQWKTVLVCGEGPGGKHYFAVDVTHPSPGDPGYNADAPFTPLWHTNDEENKTDFEGKIGYSWSTPAFGRIRENGAPKYVVFVGSGYDDPGTEVIEGKTFMTIKFDSDEDENGKLIFDADIEPPAGTIVDYALIADVVSVTENGFTTELYISDLGGRIWYLDTKGDVDTWQLSDTPLYNAGPDQPFHYSPAIARVSSCEQSCTMMVAVSGSADELDLYDTSLNFRTKIHLIRFDSSFTVQETIVINLTDLPMTETAKFPSTALVSTSPLIIENRRSFNYEVLFLVYVPPSEAACEFGNSYLIVYKLGDIGTCGFDDHKHIKTEEAGLGQVSGIAIAGNSSAQVGVSGLGDEDGASLDAIPSTVDLMALGITKRLYWKEIIRDYF